MLRAVRIVSVATLLAFVFRLSQQLSRSWGNSEVEGYTVAIGVVTLLFTIRAAATEYTRNRTTVVQRDILWGISLGAFLSFVARLTR